MTKQNFKIILTAPVSEMGHIISCATQHGGTVEMVEVEKPEMSISDAPAPHRRPKKANGVTTIDVYRVFRDFDLTDSSAHGVRKALEAKLGRAVNPASVNAAIHRLNQHGFVSVTTPERKRYRKYAVNGVSLTDDHFANAMHAKQSSNPI